MPATFFTDTPILWAACLAVWIVMETLAVTVCLHRHFTHRSFDAPRRAVLFWLWWARSGMVKYWEWVENHLWHHAHADTDADSYTPWLRNRLTGVKPLPPPRPWQFWANAVSYAKMSDYLRDHREELDRLAARDESVRRSLKYLYSFDDVRRRFGAIWRGLWINLVVFAVVAAAYAVPTFGWWALVVIPVMAWLAIGIKVVLYLLGGYIINYYGHQRQVEPHQSDIPWWLMIVTLWVMGEGWHKLHHDAPYSARLHPSFDPGWWVIRVMASLRLATNVVIAIRDGNGYQRRVRFNH